MSNSEVVGTRRVSEDTPSTSPNSSPGTISTSLDPRPTDPLSLASVQNGGSLTTDDSASVVATRTGAASFDVSSNRQPSSSPTSGLTGSPTYSTVTNAYGYVWSYTTTPIRSGAWIHDGKGYSSFKPTVNYSNEVEYKVPRPTANGEVFNLTVAVTQNYTSPMVNLDRKPTWGNGTGTFDPATGYRTLENHMGGSVPLYFVGVGYVINGTAKFKAEEGERGADFLASNNLWTLVGGPLSHRQPLSYLQVNDRDPDLGTMSNLNLSAYQVDYNFGGRGIHTIHNFTVHIPVKTQARNFWAMKSQAKTTLVTENDGLTSSMDVAVCSVAEELNVTFATYERALPDLTVPETPNYEIADGHAVLLNNTELVYTVPSNTTLVEVLGPVGTNSRWAGDYPPADLINATETNSSAADPFNTESNATNKTPVIVGVVVGVGGGLVLLILTMWLLHRHRKQRAEREKEYLPDPYSNDEPVEPRSKAELEQMARGEDPRRVSDTEGSGDEATAEPRRRRVRRIVQEEDGESVVEYLPPQYREAWQAGAERGPSQVTEGEIARPSAEAEVRQLDRPSSAPIQDPALAEKVGGLDTSGQPPLKQAYARIFSRALPRPPHSSVSSDQPQSGSDASDGGLKQEYMKRFGPSPRGPREAGGESSQVNAEPVSFDGLDEDDDQPIASKQSALSSVPRPEIDRRLSTGSADFADESSSSQRDENLKEQYKRWFS